MSSAERQVCVIGAQGVLGAAVMHQFQSAGWQVHPAGRKADARPGFRHVDLDRPEAIASAMSDVDLVVSTVAHPGLTAERLVAERGGTLVNCSHASGHAARAIAMDTGQPRGTVLLNGGLVPGVANLVAADLLRGHPEADCLEVAFTVLNRGSAGRAAGEFAYRGLACRSHHRVSKLPLPDPFGDLACIEIDEQEDGGYYAGVARSRRVETYVGLGDWPLSLALRAANALRLMRLLPRIAFTVQRGDPNGLSSEPTVVWVGARRGGERLDACTIECEGDYRTTAAMARIFGERLAGSGRPGCFNPEDLFELSDLRPSLDKAGIKIADAAI
jgi:hypothetical protein